MLKICEAQENLTIIEGEAAEINETDGRVSAVKLTSGQVLNTKSVVVCCGVYLNSRTITGEVIKLSGPAGFVRATKLTQSLASLGFEIRRFKTGTPPRLDGDTIDYSKFEVQKGDRNIQSFSFLTKKTPKNICVCHLGYTTLKTKEIILKNLSRAPMYNGVISSTGPRYCPSIETKIVRFADHDRHQLFLEPETLETNEIYLQGMSTSMPSDVQTEMVESVNGLEHAKITKWGYAIEYDCINPLNLYPTLEFKKVKGLFCAGQINGTSGYEEAAAQGLLAGINASLYNRQKPQLILTRDNSYLGVLVDDLTTKGTNEPYRMMTSRAEYRLLLRQDNADLRLTQIGRDVGLVDDNRYKVFTRKLKQIARAKQQLNTRLTPSEVNDFLARHDESPALRGITIEELLKRSKISIFDIKKELGLFRGFSRDVLNQVGIDVKYAGYLMREKQLIERNKKLDEKPIPDDLDFMNLHGIRIEARQKLAEIKPKTIGQASRISGVNPADITILLLYCKK